MNCDDTVTTVSSTTSRDSTRGATVPPTVSPPRSSPDVGRSNHHLHSGESPHSGDCASDEPPCTVPFWESTVEPILGYGCKFIEYQFNERHQVWLLKSLLECWKSFSRGNYRVGERTFCSWQRIVKSPSVPNPLSFWHQAGWGYDTQILRGLL